MSAREDNENKSQNKIDTREWRSSQSDRRLTIKAETLGGRRKKSEEKSV